MKLTRTQIFVRSLLVIPLALTSAAASLQAQPADPGWPRVFAANGKELTIHQPQVDYWKGYTNIHFRCAIAVKGVLAQERFGVVEVDAATVVEQANRTVAVIRMQHELRFPNASEQETALLGAAVDELHPRGAAMVISLDRVLAYVNPADQPTQPRVQVNLEPPRIFYSERPAILVMFLGEPQFKPVETNRTDLLFALNTNWELFYDTASQHYYLLDQETWLSATDVRGPWSPAQTLPPSLYHLPASDNWATARRNLPGRTVTVAPTVFVSTEPAELIVTAGAPSYTPIPTTRLFRVANTESVLFADSTDWSFYFLVAGRWFRAKDLNGPWSAASKNLPADFARIPGSDPSAFAKASVPGTREATDAVLLASIPTTTTVYRTNVTVQVVYNGAPQFAPIETTTVQYAANSPQQVFLVGGSYYCCDAGVWFVSPCATGPWAFCTVVPAAIYTIPVTSPYYNVTYVRVQSHTPTTVAYCQTAGYCGEYVAATGALVFGAGMYVGPAVVNVGFNYCYPPYPCFYSYGCAATYSYGCGGYYYAGGATYGPYGGAGYATAYNPATGTYSRSASAYGPNGSATAHAAYNPYTGGYAGSGHVTTPYGSAGGAAGYNPHTGTYAAGGYQTTPYGSTGGASAYNPITGNSAHGDYWSGQNGTVAAGKTSQGTGGVASNTANGQGGVAKTASGDVYAGRDGTVYKRDSSGNWYQNTGSGWTSTTKPQPSASSGSSSPQPQAKSSQAQGSSGSWSQNRPTQPGSSSGSPSWQSQPKFSQPQGSSGSWSQNRSSLESQAQARSWGNQNHQSAQSWRSSGPSHSFGGFGGFGGRGGLRR